MTYALIFVALAIAAFAFRALRVPVSHRWRRRQARAMCVQLRGRDRGQPAALVYARLRAMDPLAFEELLLEAFSRRGHPIVRNRRYTGDGGVDGQVTIGATRWLIQAKRYRSAIRPEHVDEFARLCRQRHMRGLFIHTGRTGGTSHKIVSQRAQIQIISGSRLLALLSGEPVHIGTEVI